MTQRPRVYLHIGEPKTGTTYLQKILWAHRPELAAQGVVLPGHHAQDHMRATQDLREIVKGPRDPSGSWVGEWQILARQACQAPQAAIISHELFCAATPDQARRALDDLARAEVHLVLTVRDVASLLPAEWQESVKHRNALDWEGWLRDVIDDESDDPDRRRFWHWRVHDTIEILRIWGRDLPPERVHVITVPPRGAPKDLLWQRFASVVGLDPASVDTSAGRSNESLGLAEVEVLRRFNAKLREHDVPEFFYMRHIKEPLAHGVLAERPKTGRLELPAARRGWAQLQAKVVITALREMNYDVVGDLDDLLPAPATADASHPDDVSDAELLDVATSALVGLHVHHWRQRAGASRPALNGSLGDRLLARVSSSERVKRAVREASSRHPAVGRLRIAAWRALERSRRHGR